jgi:prophage antirepressor-like protein
MNMEIFRNSEFGSIRVIEEDGKYLFCGSDVAKALGYAKPRNAIHTHCKGALKRGSLTDGGVQELTFIPEGDVYRLIVHSRLPGAERFEKWVFDEVLPTIRRSGGYMTPSLLEEAARRPEILLSFADQLLAEHEKTGVLPGRWSGCGRKRIFTTPLCAPATAPISGPRPRSWVWASATFAVS